MANPPSPPSLPSPPSPPSLADFPLVAQEKLRYSDTDRQGHINNAVFATMLETGRVELLYAQDGVLHEPACSVVIASLHLDFLDEVHWPGAVKIGTRVEKIGRSSVTLGQAIFQDDRCVATSTSVIVQVGLESRRAEPLSEHALAKLNTLLAKAR
ncbi:MAG: acyl-CoA thioesterase [Burkholderiales bacterium]|jgi:acyl-CoA thioester hydrolase|nr:acyl-CoA thioesterase [Nitrosomonadaceae bacterium]